MAKSRLIHLLLSLTLVFTIMGGFALTNTAAFAQTPTPTPTPTSTPQPTLTLDSKYPVLTNDSGQSFTFGVDIKYAGNDKKTFNISATPPPGWSATTTAGYPETQVSAVQISPVDINTPSTESVKVNLIPNQGKLPDPGDYTVTLKVSSGSLTQSIDLKATVKAKYSFTMTTETGNLNTQATAGKENHFSVSLINTGSAPIDKLSFTSTKPDGWIINFKPDKVDSLGSGQTTQVDVVITPPEGKTIAGDYIINLKSDNGTVSKDMDVRVTVLTPTIWGWVGIIIIVVVIAGLAVLFMKLGRR